MTRSSVARVRRRMVKRGTEAELRRRGVDPRNPEAQQMIRNRILKKEVAEQGTNPEYVRDSD